MIAIMSSLFSLNCFSIDDIFSSFSRKQFFFKNSTMEVVTELEIMGRIEQEI